MNENQHDQELQQKSRQVADKHYPSAESKKDGDSSSGIAKTHEQAADTLTEGTIDPADSKGGNKDGRSNK